MTFTVYSINCDNQKYYGMTECVKSRLKNHNYRLRKNSPIPLYQFLRGRGICHIDRLEVVDTFNDKEEAHEFERNLIRTNKENCLNAVTYYMKPTTNRWARWYLQNKEARLAKRRERMECEHCGQTIVKEKRKKHYEICQKH
jgi:predicted GIY-YIG superfamily endonuclease